MNYVCIFHVHGPQYAFVLTRTSLPPSLYSSSSTTTTTTTTTTPSTSSSSSSSSSGRAIPMCWFFDHALDADALLLSLRKTLIAYPVLCGRYNVYFWPILSVSESIQPNLLATSHAQHDSDPKSKMGRQGRAGGVEVGLPVFQLPTPRRYSIALLYVPEDVHTCL